MLIEPPWATLPVWKLADVTPLLTKYAILGSDIVAVNAPACWAFESVMPIEPMLPAPPGIVIVAPAGVVDVERHRFEEAEEFAHPSIG